MHLGSRLVLFENSLLWHRLPSQMHAFMGLIQTMHNVDSLTHLTPPFKSIPRYSRRLTQFCLFFVYFLIDNKSSAFIFAP